MRRRRGRWLRRTGSRVLLFAGALAALGFAGLTSFRWLSVAVAKAPPPPAAPPDAGAPGTKPKPEKVKIWFFTVPTVKAELRWGKKKLGLINATKKPFFIERPKDSGPMDVVVRAEGFLPLNTRVYTYADNKVWLKLTPETEKHKILGFKIEIPDAGADGGADGGVLMPPVAGPIPGAPAPLQPSGTPAGTPPPGYAGAPGSPPAAAPAPQPAPR